MSDSEEKKNTKLKQDGMTVGEFAAMWQVPPWKADCRLRKLVKDGTVIQGNVVKTYTDHDNDEYERSVEKFALAL